MKKIIFIALVALTSNVTFSQKNKTATKKPGATATAKGVLAKADNLVAEVKSGTFQLTINENGKPKDAITIKNVDAKFAPTNTKLTAFKANGAALYLLTYTENNILKTDLKTEDMTTVTSIIYEIPTKKQVFSNTQMTNHIIEKVFLDKLKNASETQERLRREGFEFTLNPDGSITQKNKTQENKWVYDVAKMEYVDAKKKK
ncbi:hypothetical protein [Flavobacterium sp.]|jgi:hypothetical protein|uniref:hypothetical protein n=1 Tax=Flavobacterium sp. TaxID=239 RepID=UPI0037C114BA